MRRVASCAILLFAAAAASGGEKRSHFDVVDLSGAVVYRMTAVVKPTRVDVVLVDASGYRYAYRWELRTDDFATVHRVEALDSGDSIECTLAPGQQIALGVSSRGKANELVLSTDDLDRVPEAKFEGTRDVDTRLVRMVEDLLTAKRDPLRFLFCRNFETDEAELQCADFSSMTTRTSPPDCAFDESFGFPCSAAQKQLVQEAAQRGRPLEIY